MTDYFDDYFFTSNVSSHTCPGFGGNVCKPPNACARDPNTGRRFCCDVKDVCWTLTETCASDGSTLDCGTGSTTWCCVNAREECTQAKNQINICWSTAHDVLNNISNSVLNDTYSSLSSAKPSATTWSFSPDALIALTDPGLTATSAPASSGTSTPASTTATGTGSPSNNASPPASGLAGGAIAGVAVGAVAGVALIAAGLFFLWRRSRQQKYHAPGTGPLPGGVPQEGAAALDDKPRYAGAPDFGGGGGGYYNNGTPPPGSYLSSSSPPASELHGDMLVPQELPAHSVVASELSATAPSAAGGPAVPLTTSPQPSYQRS